MDLGAQVKLDRESPTGSWIAGMHGVCPSKADLHKAYTFRGLRPASQGPVTKRGVEMGRKVSPVPRRLTSQPMVRRWVSQHSGTIKDYITEHQLARGQTIIKKLESLCALYEKNSVPSEVYGMAVTLLHDPHAIEEEDT